MLGAYGPGNNFYPQKNFQNFGGSFLNLSVSTNGIGIVVNEGVTYNWLRRQLVVCGGQQVLKDFFVLKKTLFRAFFSCYSAGWANFLVRGLF